MKFIVKKEILLESLNNTARAISTKNLIPILTGIKLPKRKEEQGSRPLMGISLY